MPQKKKKPEIVTFREQPPQQFIRAKVKGVVADFDSNQEVGVNPSVG